MTERLLDSSEVERQRVKRLRYVRGSRRTWRPRKTHIPDEDWVYYGDERPEKEPPDLSPNMLAVYHALGPEEHTVTELVNKTGMTKTQVNYALQGLHYRYLVDRVSDGLRNAWIIR